MATSSIPPVLQEAAAYFFSQTLTDSGRLRELMLRGLEEFAQRPSFAWQEDDGVPLHTWSSQALLREGRINLSRVRLHPGPGMPVHDHRGMASAMLVKEGRVGVCHYDIDAADAADAADAEDIVELICLGCHNLQPGDDDFLVDGHPGSLHRLFTSGDQMAEFVGLILAANPPRQRHLYLPLAGHGNRTRFKAMRIRMPSASLPSTHSPGDSPGGGS